MSAREDEEFLDDPLEALAEEEVDIMELEEDEVDLLRQERDQLKDRLMRALADVENTRKRGERDRRAAGTWRADRRRAAARRPS